MGLRPRQDHCPSCNSIIYTRRHRRCSVCEQVLPEEFLFTQTEADRLTALIHAEHQRHRNWLVKHDLKGW